MRVYIRMMERNMRPSVARRKLMHVLFLLVLSLVKELLVKEKKAVTPVSLEQRWPWTRSAALGVMWATAK
jgi:hypothetical protein